ncbi:MAG: hypothetical protein ACYTKD_01440 [Planctomycetota bacterium]|jgi:hypothetical protein
MFRVEFDGEAKEHVLVAEDGQKLPVRDDVWERLKDANEIFTEWKQLLQKWSIHADRVDLLKRECPDEAHYRSLRTAIRTYEAQPEA